MMIRRKPKIQDRKLERPHGRKARLSLIDAHQATEKLAGPAIRVLVVDNIAELRRHEQALDGLAKCAAEPNVFLEPWMLFPALEAFSNSQTIIFLLFFVDEPKGPELCGFIPLERRASFHGLPLRSLTLWRYPHSFLATPLLRKSYADEVMNAFFAWVQSQRRGALLLELPRISCFGDLHLSLERILKHQRRLEMADTRYERALFRPRQTAEIYLQEALSKKRRKEFKRLERQLSEKGRLVFDKLDPGVAAGTWIEEFLQLEASGWKGREGTAFAAEAANRTFFQKIAEQAALRGRLEMLALRLDGKAIAMKCNLLASGGSFAFKIAYDEDFHHHSPGVLLELAQIHWLHADSTRLWMDSCADHDHFMINRLWLDRKPLRTLVVSTGHPLGNLAVRIVRFLKFFLRFFSGRNTERGKRYDETVLPVSSP
jgi:CelD/BcsL family acetyltransferase involved in cellulose biosynthesis